MGERLTESEKDALFAAAAIGRTQDDMYAAVERILAARGAGDGLAGRLRELCDRKYVAFNPTGSGYETYIRCDDVLALLDPDAQGADEEA